MGDGYLQVKPSLLHGDLWSGNISAVEDGEWAILDPATYYGARIYKPIAQICVWCPEQCCLEHADLLHGWI